ncbi:hypothetical protein AAEX37_00536 [Oligella sp. MSHR50489EDL]|uniref:GNAT family N-acetyltransferase n=1 Tax=Oligella sp. MSHR50489EDL TaxID=3139409 RepID=UPI003D812842
MLLSAIRNATLSDLDTMLRIQAQCYCAALIESRDAFTDKLQSFPQWSFVVEANNTPCAYLLCLPVSDMQLPALNTARHETKTPSTQLYLHDLAVSPDVRGHHLAQKLIHHAISVATPQFSAACLIAVQDSQNFWQRQGFEPVDSVPHKLVNKIRSFGTTAQLMRRKLKA